MICKVCGRNTDKHDKKDVETCLMKGFGIDMSGVNSAVAAEKIVVSQAQESPDKHYFKLVLSDNTVVETYSLNDTLAVLLLSFGSPTKKGKTLIEVFDEPKEVVEPEPEEPKAENKPDKDSGWSW